MRVLDYIPGPLAALALLVSIGGSAFSWNQAQGGLKGLTALGWTAIAMGALALFGSLILTWRNHRELDSATRQRQRLREVAHAEVRLAIKQVTFPFFTLFGDDTEEAMLDLSPEHIEDPERLSRVLAIDIRSKDRPFPGGTFDIPWSQILKMNADRGADRIDRALQIYAAYLEAEVIELLSDFRTSEFLVLRLQGLDELVEMNTRVKLLRFPFPGSRKGETLGMFGYQGFWRTVLELDQTLAKDPARLRRRL